MLKTHTGKPMLRDGDGYGEFWRCGKLAVRHERLPASPVRRPQGQVRQMWQMMLRHWRRERIRLRKQCRPMEDLHATNWARCLWLMNVRDERNKPC